MITRNVLICVFALISSFMIVENVSASISVKDAIVWAESQVGEVKNTNCGQNHSWATWCGRFTAHAYDNCTFGFVSAWDAWISKTSTLGPQKTDQNIPVGALVFFDQEIFPPYGHVGIYVGGGMMIHAWTDKIRKEPVNAHGYYVGWRWPHAWTDDSPSSTSTQYRLVSDVDVYGQIIALYWTPADVSCKNAEKWCYDPNGLISSSELCSSDFTPAICDTVYDRLRIIDYKYNLPDWIGTFFADDVSTLSGRCE
jgi:hypothetical protein